MSIIEPLTVIFRQVFDDDGIAELTVDTDVEEARTLGAQHGAVLRIAQRRERAPGRQPRPGIEKSAEDLPRKARSPPGEARWLVEENEQPWPPVAQDEATRRALRDTTQRLLAWPMPDPELVVPGTGLAVGRMLEEAPPLDIVAVGGYPI